MVEQKHREGRENGYRLDFHLAKFVGVSPFSEIIKEELESVDLCVEYLCRKLKQKGPLLNLYFVKPLLTNEVVTSSTVQEGPKGSVIC